MFRWVEVLRLSARAELPPDYNQTAAESEKSTNSHSEKSGNVDRKKSASTVGGQPGLRDTRSASSTEYENS